MNTGGFGLYYDAALTAPVILLQSQHVAADFPTSNDFHLYFGSVDSNKTLRAITGNIELSIVDSAPASGYEVTDIKMALSEAGLGAGTDVLDLGVIALEGGTANALDVWVRITDSIGAIGVSNELSFATNTVRLA